MLAAVAKSSEHVCAPEDQVFADITSPLKAAAIYWDHGLVVIPSDPETGVPLVKWGNEDDLEKAAMLAKFGATTNVSIICGAPSGGYVDFDLDDDEAVKAAPSLLPETEFVFGRQSRPRSHYGYRATSQLKTITFQAPKQFGLRPFVDLLAQKHLVTAPTSVHPKSGEKVRFEDGAAGLPTVVDADLLIRRAVMLAITAFFSHLWPPSASNRQALALTSAGALLTSGLDTEEVRSIIETAARNAGDDEHEKRGQTADDTAKKLASGSPFTGWPSLKKELGEVGPVVVNTLQQWLGHIGYEPPVPSLSDVVVSAEELIASDILEKKCIVVPWLKEGTITLVYGQGKSAKTMFCLELSISITTGLQFLDYEISGNRTVLYVDGEMGRSDIKTRLTKLAGGGQRLLLLTADTFAEKFDRTLDLTRRRNQEAVDAFIKEQGIEVVVVDSLFYLAPRRDENDNASPELQSLMQWTLALKAKGVSVVLVHHAGHDGRNPRGASALVGFVDTVVALRRCGDEGNLVELEFTHTRDKRPDPHKLVFRINDGGAVVTLDVVGVSKLSPEHALLPLLLKGQAKTQMELATAAGRGTGTISNWLKKLRAQKLVHEKGLSLTPAGKEKAAAMG